MIKYGSYKKEYLITNSLGTYCSSNYLYGNTRKYHSLLSSTLGGQIRINIINRILDVICFEHETYPLHSNIYENHHIDPEGFRNISNFSFRPIPTWTYRLPHAEILKSYLIAKDDDTIIVKYSINSSKPGLLKVNPMLNIRSVHENGKSTNFMNYRLINSQNGVILSTEMNLNLYFNSDKGLFTHQPLTYFKLFYPDEELRGYDPFEDLYVPGYFLNKFNSGSTDLYFTFGLNNYSEKDFGVIWNSELQKITSGFDDTDLETKLKDQSNHFIVKTNKHNGLLAGLHWFDEWARDTFISIFGLIIAQNDNDYAEKIFTEWGNQFQDGLLPNRLFINKVLNSIDGMFWYVIRLYEFCNIKQDFSLAEKYLPEIEKIYLNILEKNNNLRITEKGYLFDDESHEARTWMDAIVDNKPVTDRSGKAVEIQALWYNYLRILIILKEKFDDRTHLKQLKNLKILIEKNFENDFWNNSSNCLYDVIKKNDQDKSIRPNQLIVLYLPFRLLSSRKSKMILATAEQKLLTPVGIRTLSREDEKYIENYLGSQQERDKSYHQGTIWPYLLGIYLISYLKTYNFSKSSKQYVKEKLDELNYHIRSRSITYLPEVFSDQSMEPQGCISQAWSVATILETFYYLKNK